mmetsp:Transcript_2733/g.4659  ORF Transcript_2733/g.4659 Transcript_2733/m.4659 type:complete len:220 (-) Transcript_2733:884-1543(-)
MSYVQVGEIEKDVEAPLSKDKKFGEGGGAKPIGSKSISQKSRSNTQQSKYMLNQNTYIKSLQDRLFVFNWGRDFLEYNTVCWTSLCWERHRHFWFFLMQLSRMLCFLVLMICSIVYFYIFVRNTPIYFNFYPLIFSTIAFYFLFVGTGKQMVYQKNVKRQIVTKNKHNREERRPVIDFNDPNLKQDGGWLWGVFFYSIAFPLSLVSAFVYNTNLNMFFQ